MRLVATFALCSDIPLTLEHRQIAAFPGNDPAPEGYHYQAQMNLGAPAVPYGVP